MSYNDINTIRRRAELLLRQASFAETEGERRRLIDLAAHWHACTLMGAASLARAEERKVA